MTEAADDTARDQLPDEEAFRDEVLAFLSATLPRKGATTGTTALDGKTTAGAGSAGADLGSGVHRAVNYQRRLYDSGLAGITWPAAYGGRGLPDRYQRIFDREVRAFQIPPQTLEIGLGMCGPTIVAYGTEEQKRAFIPPLLRGEHIWCELFSEPAAGSDLSSVQTRARRDGDEFVVDGQKVWTSGAQHSDYAACLTRSHPSRPKREGITMLIVDMHAPGITVRPLRQMNGEAHFNEVFLDGVRVPVANALGGVDEGWRVARTMLAFERQALSTMGSGGGNRGGFAALVAEAHRRDLSSRPALRDHLVRLRIRQMVLGHLTAYLQVQARRPARSARAREGGAGPVGDGPAGRGPGGRGPGGGGLDGGGMASMLKLAMAEFVQESALVSVEVAGLHATAWEGDDPNAGRWCNQLLSSRSASLGGGTNEIMRNVIAERVLGLPRDEEGDLMPGDLDGTPTAPTSATGSVRGESTDGAD